MCVPLVQHVSFQRSESKEKRRGWEFGASGHICVLSSVLDKLNAEDETGKPWIPRVPVLYNCRGHCSEKDTVEYNLELPLLSPAFSCLWAFHQPRSNPLFPFIFLRWSSNTPFSTSQTQVKHDITHRPNKTSGCFWLGIRHSVICFTSPVFVYLPVILPVCLFWSKCLLSRTISNYNLSNN